MVERAERVAGRSPSQAHRRFDGGLVRAQPGRSLHVIQQGREGLGADQSELEMLSARTDRGQNLVRISGREYEDDVGRRLLQSL